MNKMKRNLKMTYKEFYKNQFKEMVKHEDAVLILSSEDDPEFVSKWTSCICINLFLADLIGEEFPRFQYQQGTGQ